MVADFSINGTLYSSKRALIIAELGTSHGGDPGKAREMADAAAEAGADCIKVQIVYAREILHPKTGLVPLPGGAVSLYDRFKALEADPVFYADLKEYAETRGLLFLAAPFGLQSARELRALEPKALKIASPELNYTALVRELASYDLPVFLSAGVARLGDIEEALALLPLGKVCLLHCVTAYPAPEEDYNLRVLPNLAGIFGLPVGLSDHSLDPELAPMLGIAMGAAAVEKHFCLSRDDPGLDDPIALPPADFARMVRGIRRASGLSPQALIEALSRERGAERVAAVLGVGVKRLAPAAAAKYTRTHRSIQAVRDRAAGETLAPAMFAVLRTEKTLRPGLPPSWEDQINGRKAASFIPAGEGIRFVDIL
jgi:sialic acid synthase SpsE